MRSHSSPERFPWKYFLLVYALSVPFWLLGGKKLPVPMDLPASSFMWITPVIAASILSYSTGGLYSVKRLLKRALDYKQIGNKTWYIAIFVLVPLIYAVSYLIMRWADLPLPDRIEVPLAAAPIYFLMFLIPAAAEELGWSGYATEPLQQRWGALMAGLVVGLVWQIWHIVPNIQADRSTNWILWHSIYSVALRVVMVWIFNNTGKSVVAAILVHSMDNVSWSLFPNDGSHLDPRVTSVVAWFVVLLVLVRWEPKTLTRRRNIRARLTAN